MKGQLGVTTNYVLLTQLSGSTADNTGPVGLFIRTVRGVSGLFQIVTSAGWHLLILFAQKALPLSFLNVEYAARNNAKPSRPNVETNSFKVFLN